MPTMIFGLLHQANITLKEVSEISGVPVSSIGLGSFFIITYNLSLIRLDFFY